VQWTFQQDLVVAHKVAVIRRKNYDGVFLLAEFSQFPQHPDRSENQCSISRHSSMQSLHAFRARLQQRLRGLVSLHVQTPVDRAASEHVEAESPLMKGNGKFHILWLVHVPESPWRREWKMRIRERTLNEKRGIGITGPF
jgi:hypothetical protein